MDQAELIKLIGQMNAVVQQLRARQDVLEKFVEVTLRNLPSEQSVALVQQAQRLFSSSRLSTRHDWHPDADASALSLLAGLLEAAQLPRNPTT